MNAQVTSTKHKKVDLPPHERLKINSERQVTLKQGGIDIEGVQLLSKAFMRNRIVWPCLAMHFDKLLCAPLSTRNLHEADRAMTSVSSRRLRKELSEIHAEGCPCGNTFYPDVDHLFTP